jgi:hypothetical protein
MYEGLAAISVFMDFVLAIRKALDIHASQQEAFTGNKMYSKPLFSAATITRSNISADGARC